MSSHLTVKVIVPDPSLNHLVVYTLTGDLFKRIPCDFCIGKCVKMCIGGVNSVVVSLRDSNAVFKLNIEIGEVLWKYQVCKPRGVACFKNRYILI